MADYISREAALDFHIPTDDLNISAQDQWAIGDRFEEFLKSIPPADVRPVKIGRYVTDDMGDSSCSECGEKYLDITKRFCPECGAELRRNDVDQ